MSGWDSPASIIRTRLLLEAKRPNRRIRLERPSVSAKIVDQFPLAHRSGPLFPATRRSPSDLEMKGGRLGGVNTQLHDRNISRRIDMPKHGPGSMIETP